MGTRKVIAEHATIGAGGDHRRQRRGLAAQRLPGRGGAGGDGAEGPGQAFYRDRAEHPRARFGPGAAAAGRAGEKHGVPVHAVDAQNMVWKDPNALPRASLFEFPHPGDLRTLPWLWLTALADAPHRLGASVMNRRFPEAARECAGCGITRG